MKHSGQSQNSFFAAAAQTWCNKYITETNVKIQGMEKRLSCERDEAVEKSFRLIKEQQTGDDSERSRFKLWEEH